MLLKKGRREREREGRKKANAFKTMAPVMENRTEQDRIYEVSSTVQYLSISSLIGSISFAITISNSFAKAIVLPPQPLLINHQ